jgi:hypothetical protein
VKDFSPVYHTETIGGKVGAYNWDADKIKGADTVALNTKKDFALNFTEPNFNWNQDIETFEMMPLAAGKTFAINFYDAGYRQTRVHYLQSYRQRSDKHFRQPKS